MTSLWALALCCASVEDSAEAAAICLARGSSRERSRSRIKGANTISASTEARRDRGSVTLIAVSKTFDSGTIAAVIEAGQRVFGENRVQEAKTKWPGLMAAYPGIALHLIGPLQSNKAREAVALFDAIHSVDRPSICEALAKEFISQKRRPQLFVQLNTDQAPPKGGVARAEGE